MRANLKAAEGLRPRGEFTSFYRGDYVNSDTAVPGPSYLVRHASHREECRSPHHYYHFRASIYIWVVWCANRRLQTTPHPPFVSGSIIRLDLIKENGSRPLPPRLGTPFTRINICIHEFQNYLN